MRERVLGADSAELVLVPNVVSGGGEKFSHLLTRAAFGVAEVKELAVIDKSSKLIGDSGKGHGNVLGPPRALGAVVDVAAFRVPGAERSHSGSLEH